MRQAVASCFGSSRITAAGTVADFHSIPFLERLTSPSLNSCKDITFRKTSLLKNKNKFSKTDNLLMIGTL